jgi:large subunit ribosomal protein L3
MPLGLLGKKLGVTRVFDKESKTIPVTVIKAGPCAVVQKKIEEVPGYYAIQLGFDDKKEKSTTKPLLGHFKKANVTPKRFIQEIRGSKEQIEKFEVGKEIKVPDIFKVGDHIDVTGITKGRGFTGVMKRYNFHGAPMTHGTHEFRRHGGSLSCARPGRIFKNKKMPGHYGTEQVTIQNLEIVNILPDGEVLFLKGAVPGPTNGYLVLKHSIKKKVFTKKKSMILPKIPVASAKKKPDQTKHAAK